ncbi:flagellar assembly protein FliH [Herbaspirillum sp. GCM10030257]|uniref:flagellar assembly protein FliH n=1 Tax=Herbaspirillum sp. GCM10030257 TaxID=3273393 RepID=UPI00360EF6DA
MSNFIPKEQLSAYQRWELASFDSPPPPTQAELAAQREQGINEARVRAYAVGVEEGRAAGYEQGHAQGMEEGHAAGLTKGHAQGLEEGRLQAKEEAAQLQRIAAAFQSEVTQASERVAVDVLDLALDLSKAMLKNALKVRPELLIPVIGDAIRYLPTVQQPALLFLQSDDALLVKQIMGDELEQSGWRVVEDPHMQRGGCRVETASNQIDASAATRWKRIAAALGKELDWLDT